MLHLVLAASAAAVVAGVLNKRRVARAIEDEFHDRFPVDDSGVVNGAEGYTLPGTNGRALLLLHGSGDTPQSLRHLADRLHDAGFTIHAPLLPGHGRSPRDFATASAADYHAAANRALDELIDTTAWVGVVGLSMGGALAARLAHEATHVRVLVLLAPYLTPPGVVRWIARTSWVWGPISPYLRGRGESSVHDATASATSRAYGTFSPGALEALMQTAAAGRGALSQITMPTLVVNSEQDNRIPPKLARRVLKQMRVPAEVHWVTGCGHVLTMDYCKDVVAGLVLTFLARHAD